MHDNSELFRRRMTVVPLGTARIRVQLSAAHSPADVETAVRAFVEARDAEAA